MKTPHPKGNPANNRRTAYKLKTSALLRGDRGKHHPCCQPRMVIASTVCDHSRQHGQTLVGLLLPAKTLNSQ